MATRIKAPLVFGIVTLLVMLPLLAPGHLFTLDMAFTPRLPMPELTSSSYLFKLLLHVFSIFLPAGGVEKLLYITILMLSGIGLFQLVRYLSPRKQEMADEWGLYVGSVLYMINPFTYSRFMTGQYSVLLGYSLLPFFLRALLIFLDEPDRKNTIRLGMLMLLISIVSIHTLGLVAVLALTAIGLRVWKRREEKPYIQMVLKRLALCVIAVVIASSYWLVPFLSGNSTAAQSIQRFTVADQTAFQTTGTNPIMRLGNVIRLQGFWAEGTSMYELPQNRMPAWGLITIIIWVVAFAGARRLRRQGQRDIVTILLVGAAIAAVCATIGIADAVIRAIPLLAGYREPHKFVALIALMFAVFVAFGVPQVTAWVRKRAGETISLVCLCALLTLPIIWTSIMFLGFGGQLHARHYPDSWTEINTKLNDDHDDFKVLFLPWHLYMHFGFADKTILNPAPEYFDKPTLISDDPELQGASRTGSDPLVEKLSTEILPRAPGRTDLGQILARENIKYVMVAQESEKADFTYLDSQPDLKLIRRSESLLLYENEAWHAARF